VLGRVTFEGAAVVGSARSAATLRDPAVRDAYAGMAARLGADPASFAMPEVDVAFDARATVDLGGVTLEGVSAGPGHSDSDTLWWCPEERVAWSGDQVFHGAFPLVRTNLEDWFAGLDRLAAWGPRVVATGPDGPARSRGVAATSWARARPRTPASQIHTHGRMRHLRWGRRRSVPPPTELGGHANVAAPEAGASGACTSRRRRRRIVA